MVVFVIYWCIEFLAFLFLLKLWSVLSFVYIPIWFSKDGSSSNHDTFVFWSLGSEIFK